MMHHAACISFFVNRPILATMLMDREQRKIQYFDTNSYARNILNIKTYPRFMYFTNSYADIRVKKV